MSLNKLENRAAFHRTSACSIRGANTATDGAQLAPSPALILLKMNDNLTNAIPTLLLDQATLHPAGTPGDPTFSTTGIGSLGRLKGISRISRHRGRPVRSVLLEGRKAR